MKMILLNSDKLRGEARCKKIRSLGMPLKEIWVSVLSRDLVCLFLDH